jgi:hypothetical protein
MKKQVVLLLLTIMIATTVLSTVPHVKALVSIQWIDPVYRGNEDLFFYRNYIYAYLLGTTAEALISVTNDRGVKAYVTVKVHVDWETKNITLSDVDFEMNPGASHVFSLELPIPTTVETRVLHTYTIYVLYRDSAGNLLPGWKGSDKLSRTDLAVYSQDQADSRNFKQQIDTWQRAYSTISQAAIWYSTKFKEYWAKAIVEESLGDESYSKGDFAEARIHYNKALNYTMLAVEGDVGTSTQIETVLLSIGGSVKDLLLFQGWAYLLGGIGFLLMSIGVIVYLIRKSGHKAVIKTE